MFLRIFLIMVLFPFLVYGKVNPVCQRAYAQAKNDQYTKALKTLSQEKCPLLKTYIKWLELRYPKNKASLKEHYDFLIRYPTWPFLYEIQRNMEERKRRDMSSEKLLDFLKKSPPKTQDGIALYATLLREKGHANQAQQIIRAFWISTPLTVKQAERFIKAHHKDLRIEDHKARLDFLLWHEHKDGAQALLKYVTGTTLYIAQARLALQSNHETKFQELQKKIPNRFKNNEGLLYDLVKWYRRHHEEKALAIYKKARPYIKTHQELWVHQKHIIIRDAMRAKNYREAYEVVSNHEFKSGAAFVEAEWLAGFIAIRFLNDPHKADKHFKKLLKSAKKSCSLSQAAYWGAVTAKKLNDSSLRTARLKQGCALPMTYYGQRCCEALGVQNYLVLKETASLSKNAQKEIAHHPFTPIVRMLSEMRDGVAAYYFLYLMLVRSKTTDQKIAVLELANTHCPERVIELVHLFEESHPLMVKFAYPLLKKVTWRSGIDKAFILAIIRKESYFYPKAISWVGAMGLMQIMPQTGRDIAKDLKVSHFKPSQLLNRSLNISFGQYYVQELLKRFQDNKILTLAAYNAGHGNIERKWMKKYGDPRDKDMDAPTWIELIPFTQTRFYVKKVLANYKIYKKRIGN